eukprot:CAMPEP_0182546856 /NCGR_PEP_ID=MMETSP1323-20130603/36634_1 /TAXON_ID=236787 /ORGANISM="Florenciella parvula, Strain RCC1693" /LENGTH=45 /DNA_ID= /DNA_START= /DNA_END= /DNA_ORIENTATION=
MVESVVPAASPAKMELAASSSMSSAKLRVLCCLESRQPAFCSDCI